MHSIYYRYLMVTRGIGGSKNLLNLEFEERLAKRILLTRRSQGRFLHSWSWFDPTSIAQVHPHVST